MERYDAWISRAKSSYELSKANISTVICYEDLCYQAQQAVEKAFKGLLIYFGVEPEFTHNCVTAMARHRLRSSASTGRYPLCCQRLQAKDSR